MTLSPGERIDLKKRIVSTLGDQSWQNIDLTLHEFGFPTQTDWEGRTEPYVLAMLEDGREPDLLALDSYLHPSSVPAAAPQPVTFDDPSNPWSGPGLRLFISHCHQHAEKAGSLREELAKRSVDAFVAHTSIAPTEEWEQVILAALRTCDACIALVSPEFSESVWCDQEIGFCLARNVLIVPVAYGKVPYGFVGRFHALDADRRKVSDVALQIFELLARKPQSQDAMARALIQRWKDTTSWDAARENYSFLKKIPAEVWTQQLVNEVWLARDHVYDLRTASIDWKSSEHAVESLFEDLPFERRQQDEDVPW
jgi:hypothetical protein